MAKHAKPEKSAGKESKQKAAPKGGKVAPSKAKEAPKAKTLGVQETIGRPPKYKAEYAKQAEKLCQLGATDIELADFFEVSDRTIYRWQIQHKAFCQALKAGKLEADNRVERSLYHRAVGYTFQSEKIVTVSLGNNMGSEIERVPVVEHVPPDTTAMIFWLKNRKPSDWRDKQEHDHNFKGGSVLDPEMSDG